MIAGFTRVAKIVILREQICVIVKMRKENDMARDIDLDKLLKGLEDELKDKNPNDIAYLVFKIFICRLSQEPSADVVPKSEVERLKDKYEIIYQPKGMIEANAKSEVARKIFEEIENFIPRFKVGYFSYMSLTEGITELKKKYLEDKN